VSDWHVFLSPFDKRAFSSTAMYVSYGMNANILALSATNSTATTFHYPSALMVIAPNATAASASAPLVFGGAATNESLIQVSPGGIAGEMSYHSMMNVLFEDGHVSSVTATNFNNSGYNMSTGSPAASEFWQPTAQ
jgi:hypothetical protein